MSEKPRGSKKKLTQEEDEVPSPRSKSSKTKFEPEENVVLDLSTKRQRTSEAENVSVHHKREDYLLRSKKNSSIGEPPWGCLLFHENNKVVYSEPLCGKEPIHISAETFFNSRSIVADENGNYSTNYSDWTHIIGSDHSQFLT